MQALDPTEPRLDVPNTFLQAGETYTFAATLQNFLGFRSTSDPFAVAIAGGSIPELVITAGNEYHMLVPSNLALFAQASVAVCPGQRASSNLRYIWECSLAGLQSTSVDPRFFKASAYTFEPNRHYLVSVLVVDNFGYNNTAEVVVQVGTSDLVAAIDGGDRTVGVSEPLTLDASASYDPDVRAGEADVLNVSWTCEVLPDAFGRTNTQASCATALADAATNVVDLTNYGAGRFLFAVRVSKQTDGAWRNATATVVIETTFDLVPHPVPLNLWDPFGKLKNYSEEKKARQLTIEVNNGRLAMIGLFGFLAEASVPGSVPGLTGLVRSFDGNIMSPDWYISTGAY